MSLIDNPHLDREVFMRQRDMEACVREQLALMVPSPQFESEGMEETPSRVAKMWTEELTAGYGADIEALCRTFPNEGGDGQVIVARLPVRSVCEHHLVPFTGFASIGYFPGTRVLGLSKFARVVDAFARRLQIQERLTNEIHDALEHHLQPRGVIVVVRAEHMCMTVRGVQAPGTITTTSQASGLYVEKPTTKDEFFQLVGKE